MDDTCTLGANTYNSFKVPSNLSELSGSASSSNSTENSKLDDAILRVGEPLLPGKKRDVDEQLAGIIRAQRRADVDSQRLLCPYQVSFSGEGCTLGHACPYRHLSDYTLRRLRQIIPPSPGTSNSPSLDAFGLGSKLVRWMYRENACSLDGMFCPWRRFGDDWESALERGLSRARIALPDTECASSRSEVGASSSPKYSVMMDPLPLRGQHLVNAETTLVKGSVVVDFSAMMVYNRRDGGNRRPIQRVEVAHEPSWLLVPRNGANSQATQFQQAATECDLAARACLEACYVTGKRSALTLDINGAPWAVDLDRMRATAVPKQHVLSPGCALEKWQTPVYNLVRQPISFRVRSPPSNLFGCEELRQSPSFILDDASMEEIVLGTRQGKSEPDHGPLSSISAPVATSELVGESRGALAAHTCSSPLALIDCVSRYGAGHLLTHRHDCPLGSGSQCFLAILNQSARLPTSVRQRCVLHCQLFNHNRPPIAPAMSVAEREWRQKYCQLVRFARQRWDTATIPIPIVPETQCTLHSVHLGGDEGQWVLGLLDNRAFLMMNTFPVVQRVQSTLLLDRYMRGRKEAIVDMQTLVPAYSFDLYRHCGESFGFVVVSKQQLSSVLRGEEGVIRLYPSATVAMSRVPQSHLFPAKGGGDIPSAMVLLVVAHFRGLPHDCPVGTDNSPYHPPSSLSEQFAAPLYQTLAAANVNEPEKPEAGAAFVSPASSRRRWDSDEFPLLQAKLIRHHYTVLSYIPAEPRVVDAPPMADDGTPSNVESYIYYDMHTWYPLYVIAFEGSTPDTAAQ